jgi:N-acyl-D-amino-acid deacylase
MEAPRSKRGRSPDGAHLNRQHGIGSSFWPIRDRLARRSTIGAPAAVVVIAVAASLLLQSCATPTTPSAELDVIIRGGTVLDGTGRPGHISDVGIKDGRIKSVGDLGSASAAATYDASGLYVTPGFIDIHAHTDIDALGQAKSALTQGVTTETLGADGGGITGSDVPDDITKQLAELDGMPKGINVAPYAGFNAVWEDIVGEADVRPTAAQSESMQALLQQAMQDGAWSISSGLEYPPARFSETDEVIGALGNIGKWRAMFTEHLRNEDTLAVESIEENLAIGAATGLMAEATHMKLGGRPNWGKSSTLLKLQADARAKGRLAGGDVYPYIYFSTGLSYCIPEWAQDGGVSAMLARFQDPAQRARIDKEVTEFVAAGVGGPEDILFPTRGNKTLKDLMTEHGDKSVGDAVMRVITEEPDIAPFFRFGTEDDVKTFLKDPFIAVASDGGVSESETDHPRNYGTFPRVLGRYVREQGVLTWEEAIRKMTGLPATMLGMVDRGFIAEGMAADITVFDPSEIIDRATFEKPKQYSAGVRWVFVNGVLAFEDGEPTAANAGKALRRASSMPTRPQNTGQPQKVGTEGTVHGSDGSALKLALAASQNPDQPAADGTLTVTSADGEVVLTAVRWGLLQTAPGWFSVTGVGHGKTDEEHTFLVIVDEKDPLAKPGETRATVRIDGIADTYGTLTRS